MLTAEKKRYTAAEYEMLDEGAPFQLINSDLVMSPSPNSSHQILAANIFLRINTYLAAGNFSGICLFAPLDVALDESNIFQPDLLYIAENRKAELIKDRIEGAPDMIIEILSPSTAYYDLRQKKDIYEKYGVKEYIIVDPIQQNAELYFLEQAQFVLKQKADKPGALNSILLAGLSFELEKLFS